MVCKRNNGIAIIYKKKKTKYLKFLRKKYDFPILILYLYSVIQSV